MSQPLDYVALSEHYHKLDPGAQADLRRVTSPEELAIRPVFYRLFPGRHPSPDYLRVAFCLPWAIHQPEGPSLGTAFAKPKPGSTLPVVHERRLFQVLRAEWPTDIVQLRRLLHQAEPRVDWQHLGGLLFYWGERNKRRILEDYYVHHSANTSASQKTTA